MTVQSRTAGQSVAVVQPVSDQVTTWGEKGVAPVDLPGALNLARMVAASGLAPKSLMQTQDPAAAICTAAAYGREIGLSFMSSIQSIAVINGKPSIWGDAMLSLVMATDLVERFEESTEGSWDQRNLVAICSVARKGALKVVRVERFTYKMAERAHLVGKKGPWTEYPERMMQMRARSFALRNVFPDVLAGMSMAEEVLDYPEEEPHGALAVEITEEPAQEPQELAKEPAQEPQEPPKEPAAPTNGTTEPNGDAAPPQDLTRRSCRNGPYTIPEALLPAFGGKTVIKTAGITPETLFELARVCLASVAAATLKSNYIKTRPIQNPVVSKLREEEGQELLEAIKVALGDSYPGPVVEAEEEDGMPADATAGTEDLNLAERLVQARQERQGPNLATLPEPGEVVQTLHGEGTVVEAFTTHEGEDKVVVDMGGSEITLTADQVQR